MLKPYSFLLYFLTLVVSFFVGVSYAGFVGAGKNQGLAAGAIVLGYGVIAMFFGLIIALFVAHKVERRFILRINIILTFCMVGFYAYYHIKFLEKRKAKEKQNIESQHPQKNTPSKPVSSSAGPLAMFSKNRSIEQNNVGLGMFTPNFNENKTLYFYGKPNLEKPVLEHHPSDSVTFKKSEYGGYEINTAPPWLVPDHLKLDYDMLYFKVQSVMQDFAEVTVNTVTRKTAFVNKFQGEITYWPEFLLGVHSVEFIDLETNFVYVKPLNHAARVHVPHSFMKPLRIEDQWMEVQLIDDSFKPIATGWIKWRDNEKLLIKYALLS